MDEASIYTIKIRPKRGICKGKLTSGGQGQGLAIVQFQFEELIHGDLVGLITKKVCIFRTWTAYNSTEDIARLTNSPFQKEESDVHYGTILK